jgi:hypothetical protein
MSRRETQPNGHAALMDILLDHLEGQWSMKGTLLGEPVEYALNVKWVLGHQFLLHEMRDVSNPPQYEAAVYIGFGQRDKDSIRLIFGRLWRLWRLSPFFSPFFSRSISVNKCLLWDG